jgi:hypothetical protein
MAIAIIMILATLFINGHWALGSLLLIIILALQEPYEYIHPKR